MTAHHKTPKAPTAANLIQATGQRATQARIAVLDALLAAEHALTHQEIKQQLEKQRYSIDKVTLYRVLDWVLDQGLAHKVTGGDRTWRFSALPTTEHAHFNCTDCGQIYCLEDLISTVSLTLPKGFKLQHADVAVQGVCSHCNH